MYSMKYIYIYIFHLCVVIHSHFVTYKYNVTRSYGNWREKLVKIMYADHIVHMVCDIILTIQIFL